ncbi:hypothetical protein LOTGIDRAFT_77449, partial [Lottia gigantea]
CIPGQFRCERGRCIDEILRCDGKPDCPDQTDEIDCPDRPCPEGDFQCGQGTCIDSALRCDGLPDCQDGSDE